MEKSEWQRLKVAELVQVAQAQAVGARQAPAQDQVNQWRMVERYIAHLDEMPELVLDVNFTRQPVPRADFQLRIPPALRLLDSYPSIWSTGLATLRISWRRLNRLFVAFEPHAQKLGPIRLHCLDGWVVYIGTGQVFNGLSCLG